jgi:hypothetical protein
MELKSLRFRKVCIFVMSLLQPLDLGIMVHSLMMFLIAVVPHTTLGRALVMPYAIIGIISLGLVVSSIRNVVVERAHVRKKLVGLMLKKQQKRLDFLRKRTQR